MILRDLHHFHIQLNSIIWALSRFRVLIWQYPVLIVTENKKHGISERLDLIAKTAIKIYTWP
jgi:hypothetical protein